MQNSDNCMERQIEEALDENDSSPEIAPQIDSPRMNSDNCMEPQIEEALDENDSSPEISPPIDSPRMNRNKVKRSLVESSVASPKSQQNASSDVGRLSADITVCFNRLRITRRCEMSPKSTKMQDGTNSPIMKSTR